MGQADVADLAIKVIGYKLHGRLLLLGATTKPNQNYPIRTNQD